MELEGFGIDPTRKRDMWREAVAEVARMLSEEPYPGHAGTYFSMPPRNVVPKPVQKPHPPLWLACSTRQSIHVAAQHGLGALTFAFVDPAEARHWVQDYYETFKRECVPLGKAVNPNVAMVAGFMCHEREEEARRRGLQGLEFFIYALAHYYVFGTHTPGRTSIWESFRQSGIPMPGEPSGIGTPDQIRAHLKAFETTGVDQVVFIQQGGNNRHDDICESLELFAAKVLPEFKEREAERERRKMEELAPDIERALARKAHVAPPRDLPEVHAYGRNIVDGGGGQYPAPGS
jgi:alkanesulfonate monooxygenase SsuD/methylene tetrahydromethanopterin reductase-like flavin-dependent oxidoreductase (luciferase family)